jgi:Ras-related protein Rab-1A
MYVRHFKNSSELPLMVVCWSMMIVIGYTVLLVSEQKTHQLVLHIILIVFQILFVCDVRLSSSPVHSQSLDNLPLTDPEHFGAPAILPKKPRRRAARPNYAQAAVNGDDEEEEEGDGERKGCTYPPEFPVGKTVFLENDRRRAGWIPAVIVPAHYVLEESDRKPNTICLRSFKDGRFFAVTKNELHEFSPHKEPLLSMLDGEIQPMYMCKPAIERAMAYLDTGELPWDMDLFDGQAEKERREQRVGGATGGTTPTTAAGSAASPQAKDETSEQHIFMDKLRKYHENRGTPLNRTPILAQKDLDLYRLYHLVQESGGMESVTREMKWRSIYLQLGIPLSTNASHALKQAYRK